MGCGCRNNRVLRYPTPLTKSTPTPDIVLGQPDLFTARTGNQGKTLSQNTLCFYQNCPVGSGAYTSALAMDLGR